MTINGLVDMSTVLTALNQILSSRERREQLDVQKALGFIESENNKKYREASLRLESQKLEDDRAYKQNLLDAQRDELGLSAIKERRIERAENRKIAVIEAKQEIEQQTFDLDKYESTIKSLKQISLDQNKSIYDNFISSWGLGQASQIAQDEESTIDQIDEAVRSALTYASKNLSGKQKTFIANELTGAIAKGQLSQDYTGITNLLDSFGKANIKQNITGESLNQNEQKIYSSLLKFKNVSELVQLSDLAKKSNIIKERITKEEKEFASTGDVKIAEDIFEINDKILNKKVKEKLQEKKDARTLLNQITDDYSRNNLAIGNITNLDEQIEIDLDQHQDISKQLQTSIAQRSNIEIAINNARKIPPNDRTDEQNELIKNAEDFLEQADLDIESLQYQLNNIEEELDNDKRAKMKSFSKKEYEDEYGDFISY